MDTIRFSRTARETPPRRAARMIFVLLASASAVSGICACGGAWHVPPALVCPVWNTTYVHNYAIPIACEDSGAARYDIEVSQTDDFSTLVYSIRTDTPAPDPITLPDGQYLCRARAQYATGFTALAYWSDWCPSMSFGIGGPYDPYPDNGAAIGTDNQLLLDWEKIVGAARYHAQVATDENFTTASLVAEMWMEQSSWWLSLYGLDDAVIYWRVRAENAEGAWGAWGGPWTITRTVYPTAADSLVAMYRFEGNADDTSGHSALPRR